MKKIFALIILSTFFYSCQEEEKEGFFKIDLDKSLPALNYTEFVDSVSYITFSTGDDCLLSSINKIYFDGDTIVIKSGLKAGVFVFTREGEFITQINRLGQGPDEYIEPSIMAVDKNSHIISILDVGTQKILQFNYQGDYLGSIRLEKDDHCYPHDMAINKDGNFITMKSANYGKKEHSGVWVSNKNYNYIKHILNDVPYGYEFQNITTYYNYSVHGIYYYDMNKDIIYLIENDSAKMFYQIDLKQKFPASIRKKSELIPDEANGLANICYFGITENYILLDYRIFMGTTHKWVLIDRKNNTISPAYNLLNNDIDEITDFNYRILHVDDRTICRIMEDNEDDCDITIQLLHLK